MGNILRIPGMFVGRARTHDSAQPFLRGASVSPLERPLPQDIDAERSVLGSILLDNKTLPTALQQVSPTDYFHEFHRRIFQQMIVLWEAQQPIDLVTLSDQLRRKSELEAAGGSAYLAQLVDGVPRVSHVEHYARIVKEKSMLRGVIFAMQAIQQTAQDAEEDADAILDRATTTIDEQRGRSVKKNGLTVYTAPELAALTPEPIEYIAYPFAARGMVALLDGAAKAAGKTTLILTAVGASCRGQVFLNQTTKPARILYITEENSRTFNLAVARAGLTAEPNLIIMPFTSFFGLPWPQLAREIERLCVEPKIDWLIVDTFFAVAQLGGEEENKGGAVDTAVAPLRSVTGRLDIATTLSRHERKSGGEVGNSGRGSIALTGACDSVLLLKRLPGSQDLEKRQLEITGRVEQARLDIELLEGRKYIIDSPCDGAAPTDPIETLKHHIETHPGISQGDLIRFGKSSIRLSQKQTVATEKLHQKTLVLPNRTE